MASQFFDNHSVKSFFLFLMDARGEQIGDSGQGERDDTANECIVVVLRGVDGDNEYLVESESR
jgi:hypothetical protein